MAKQVWILAQSPTAEDEHAKRNSSIGNIAKRLPLAARGPTVAMARSQRRARARDAAATERGPGDGEDAQLAAHALAGMCHPSEQEGLGAAAAPHVAGHALDELGVGVGTGEGRRAHAGRGHRRAPGAAPSARGRHSYAVGSSFPYQPGHHVSFKVVVATARERSWP